MECREEYKIFSALCNVTYYCVDVQSDLWLDDALHDIVQEHPYASLPRVPKRKKTTNNVPPLDSLSLNRPLLSKRTSLHKLL